MNKIQPPENDTMFVSITNRIIQKFDPNESRYILPKYHNPNYVNPFQINKTDFHQELWGKMEEIKAWQDMVGHVSPDTYTARVLLYIMCKRPIPLFSSNNTFRIKQLIQELENKFSSPKIREELVNHFCKFKQTYWAFTKLARIWKIRRTPTRIQTDLYMNELDPKNSRTFQLVHPNGIYLFSLQNLARIIVDAITHQSGMFVEPLTIKNPYTNGLLSKCDLFNIYFSLRNNNIRVHEMLEKFFRCEFNAFEFRRKHETELRDIAIEQYAKTASISELAQDVDDMLRMHKMTKIIKIAQGFPQKILVETMRPFLIIYLLERYSFSSMTRKYSTKKLDVMLKQFIEKNPNYGKRMPVEFVAPPDSNPFSPTPQHVKTETKYITETVSYANYCKSKYMETHIYDEDTFDRYIENGDSLDGTYLQLDTYMEPLRDPQSQYDEGNNSEVEWTDDSPPSPVYTFTPSPSTPSRINQINIVSNLQLNSAALYEETPRTVEQIQENTRAILSRLGRIGVSATVEIQNNIYINDNIINNSIFNDTNNQFTNTIENEYADNEEDTEEDEDNAEDNEEVIQNPTNEYDSESDTEWENQLMEEEEDADSVS